MNLSLEYVAYIVGSYASIWALGFGVGKSVAWVRHIRSVA